MSCKKDNVAQRDEVAYPWCRDTAFAPTAHGLPRRRRLRGSFDSGKHMSIAVANQPAGRRNACSAVESLRAFANDGSHEPHWRPVRQKGVERRR